MLILHGAYSLEPILTYKKSKEIMFDLELCVLNNYIVLVENQTSNIYH